MPRINNNLVIDDAELRFTFTTSPGPGGQNVNKVATRANLSWDVAQSPSLSDAQRARLLHELANRLDSAGALKISSSKHRSQSQNKQDAIDRLIALVAAALKPRKKRRPTRPTKGSKERRLKEKRIRSERKSNRSGGRDRGE